MTADDIVQDVFLKLWDHHAQVDPQKVKSWLFRTAHNLLINHVKRAKRQEPLNPVQHDQGRLDVHRYELQDILARHLDQLPPVQKSIVLLRDLEGYPYKEIGELMQLSESQVKVYLFRARKKLKEELKGLMELQ